MAVPTGHSPYIFLALACSEMQVMIGNRSYVTSYCCGSPKLTFAAEARRYACACAGAFQTPLRARDNCIGVGHFRATADGGVLALSFVTALLARPWKVGVPCQDHLRECSRRAAATDA